MYTLFLYIVKDICNVVHVHVSTNAYTRLSSIYLISYWYYLYVVVLKYCQGRISDIFLHATFKRLFNPIIIFFTWNIKITFFWAQWIFFLWKYENLLKHEKFPVILEFISCTTGICLYGRNRVARSFPWTLNWLTLHLLWVLMIPIILMIRLYISYIKIVIL